jgi:ketol-acid reductoisomerase
MPNVYYDNDANLETLQDKTIGIIGMAARATPMP